MQIGFIGAGNMARAIIGGLRAQGLAAASIFVSDSEPGQLAPVAAQFGVTTSTDNHLACESDVLVLAVKPQVMAQVLNEVREHVHRRQPLIVSVAAGIRTSTIGGYLARDTGKQAPGAVAGSTDSYLRIVRAMPNRPALVGAGVTGLYAASGVLKADREATEQLLAAVGRTLWLPKEDDLDVVTAVSGSGPAYFFLLIEMLQNSGCELGLDADTARTLAIETAYGSGVLAHSGEFSPAQLREQVTSKGGTTAAALAVLEEADLRGIVRRAVTAAARRSAELARETGS